MRGSLSRAKGLQSFHRVTSVILRNFKSLPETDVDRNIMSKSGSAYVLACSLVILACSRQPKPTAAFQAAPAATPVTRRDTAPNPQPASTSPAPPAVAQALLIAPKVVIIDQTEGPFRVGGQSFTFVKHVQSLHGETSGDDSTVEWWELRDATGNAV